MLDAAVKALTEDQLEELAKVRQTLHMSPEASGEE